MPFLKKLEACKECGDQRFTVFSLVSVPADICKGRLRLFEPAPDDVEDSITIAAVICKTCGRQHGEREFRLAA
jgi:hypothetical protein